MGCEVSKAKTNDGKAERFEGILTECDLQFDLSIPTSAVEAAVVLLKAIIVIVKANINRSKMFTAMKLRVETISGLINSLQKRPADMLATSQKPLELLVGTLANYEAFANYLAAKPNGFISGIKDVFVAKDDLKRLGEFDKLFVALLTQLSLPLQADTLAEIDSQRQILSLVLDQLEVLLRADKARLNVLARSLLTDERALAFWADCFPQCFKCTMNDFVCALRLWLKSFHKIDATTSQLKAMANAIKDNSRIRMQKPKEHINYESEPEEIVDSDIDAAEANILFTALPIDFATKSVGEIVTTVQFFAKADAGAHLLKTYTSACETSGDDPNVWLSISSMLTGVRTVLISDKEYTRADCLAQGLHCAERKGQSVVASRLWFNAAFLGGDFTRNGDSYTERMLYLKAIELDPSYVPAWINLGITMNSNERITVNNDPTPYTRRMLFLKAIELDPSYAAGWLCLGITMNTSEAITVNNDPTLYTKRMFYLKAVELNPSYAAAWLKLGTTMNSSETITVNNDPTLYTERMLYLKAVELDPSYVPAWISLGITMHSNEAITVNKHPLYTKRMLFLKAIELDPSYAPAWLCAGTTMDSSEAITVNNDPTPYTERTLYLKAIELNPSYAAAWLKLGITMHSNETITVNNDPTPYTKRMLFLKAIELDSSPALAWLCLGTTVNSNEAITVNNDPTPYTERALYLKAIELNPSYAPAWLKLGTTVNSNEAITINNDPTPYTKRMLYLKAVELDPTLGA